MKYLLKITKWLLFALLTLIIAAFMYTVFSPIKPDKFKDLSKVATDSSGKWLYCTLNSQDKWRFKANIDKIDPLYLKMLLNYEDKRFYKHHGADFLAISRAVFNLIKYKRVTSGASTITMQVAKLLEPKKRTFVSKIIELARAFELEFRLSKKEILQIYLTLAPYGGNIEGVEAASWRYFHKHPYALTISEAALLVALPKNPQAYRPNLHPKKAKKARDKVLKRAFLSGIISKKQYLQALNEKIDKKTYKFPRLAPHLALKVLRESKKTVIKTTLDYTLQKQFETWAKSRGKTLPKGAGMALLIIENSSSHVKVYIGSNDIFSHDFPGFIDMVKKVRSPGSALKPFIYALAFDKHIIAPKTIILDTKSAFNNYKPHNYSRKYRGEVTIAEALQNSLNIPAVKILNRLGAKEFTDKLKAVAVKLYIPKNRPTLPVALGGLGISLWHLTQSYTVLANGGSGKSIAVLPDTKQKKLYFCTPKSAAMVTEILKEIPRPKEFFDFKKAIAYKTGTSYGYRDFWSVGYSKNYTVAVWIGRPDNKPVVKLAAREIATPLMFEAFELLNSLKKVKSLDNKSSLIHTPPPKILKYFDKPRFREDSLQFEYPKDGTRFQSGGCYKATVKFKIKNGAKPLFWYIDNTPSQNSAEELKYKFSSGAHTVTVIDSNGKRTSVTIWVNQNDCPQQR